MQVNFLTTDQITIQQVNDFIEEWKSDSEFILVKTSGSTGIPKEVKLMKKHVTASAFMTGEYLQLKKNDKALLCLSPSTIAGKMMIVRSLVIGMQLAVGDVKSNPLEEIDKYFDFIAMVPLQLENTIEHRLVALSRVQKIIVGGGIVSENLSNKIPELPCEIYHTFGMTETISHVAMRNLSIGEQEFRSLPNVFFKLSDGCLVIDAPDQGVTDLKTNDIVDLLSPDSFIWKGRKDFVINSGGVKIHPEEVEAVIATIIDSPLFITGINDAKLGNKVILCVESKLNLNITKSGLSNLLDPYQIPKEIYFFDHFARTNSDKINRIETIKLISDASKQVL